MSGFTHPEGWTPYDASLVRSCSTASLFQLTDLDVLERGRVVMLGQKNWAGDFVSEVMDVLEFAVRDGFFEFRAAEFVLDDFHAVEPVLDVVALEQHARMVPLAGRMERLVGVGRNDVVEGRGALLRAVRDNGVVNHLVFVAGRFGTFLADKIFDAVVGFGWNHPVPLQIEIGEIFRADDVAAVRSGDAVQDAVLDFPAVVGTVRLAVTAPARERFAVKKQFPTLPLLARGELVWPGIFMRPLSGTGTKCGYGEYGEQQVRFHWASISES